MGYSKVCSVPAQCEETSEKENNYFFLAIVLTQNNIVRKKQWQNQQEDNPANTFSHNRQVTVVKPPINRYF